MKHQFNKFQIGALTLFLWLSGHSIAFAAVEGPEPNNDCATAQDLGEIALPFNLSGNLDGAVNPDLDYYKITGTPGSAIEIQLKGADSSSGTLVDPHLGIFNVDCTRIQTGLDVSPQNRDARIRSRFPENGVLYLAASQCCDNFDFGGNGTYQLEVKSIDAVNSFALNIVDSVTGEPVSFLSGYSLRVLYTDNSDNRQEVYMGSIFIGPGQYKGETNLHNEPLTPGVYTVELTPTRLGFNYEGEGGLFTFTVAANEDFQSEIKLQPIPHYFSVISGKIVDAVTGKPLEEFASANLSECDRRFSSECRFTSALGIADPNGNFQISVDLKKSDSIFYQLNVSGLQYQEFTKVISTNNVSDVNPNIDLGDINLQSNPVRFNNILPCKKIPRKGGSCLYSVTVANGLSTKLNGEIWSIVETFGPNINRNVEFQPKLQELSLKPGESRKVGFTFPLPASVSDNTSVCAKAYVGKKPASMWDVVGFRDLFCITKGEMGYAVMPEHEMHKLIHNHK